MAFRSVFGNRDTRERKTLANRDYYKTLVESKKDAAFLADTDGDLFLLNKKAQQITGFTEEEIRDYHLRDIFVTFRKSDNPFDSGQFSEFTAKMFLLDSSRYLIPVNIDFREIEGQKFICTCTEPAEKETTVTAREEAEKPFPDPKLPAVPSIPHEATVPWPPDFEHKVRNLLNNMLGFGSILSRESLISGNSRLTTSLDNLVKSGNQLKQLFNQFSIGLNETPEVTKKVLNLASILQKSQILMDPLSRQNSVEIRVEQDRDVSVFSDERLLLDLLGFLLEKAILYARKETVLISVASDDKSESVSLTIDNLGQDIPQAVINFIKRETSRNEYDLANPLIVQNPELRAMLSILNRIDGKIHFSTSDSMGEIARLVIPRASGIENADELSILETAIRQKKLSILIVEDEKFTARVLEMFLEDISSVSLAFSGNEALNITEICYGKGTIFDAVVMDIGLPRPWDGILLKKEMERRWPEYQNVPFLAQTAFTAKSYIDRISEARFRGFLLKPVNRIDVLRFLLKNSK